jgi:hypothetical protein
MINLLSAIGDAALDVRQQAESLPCYSNPFDRPEFVRRLQGALSDLNHDIDKQLALGLPVTRPDHPGMHGGRAEWEMDAREALRRIREGCGRLVEGALQAPPLPCRPGGEVTAEESEAYLQGLLALKPLLAEVAEARERLWRLMLYVAPLPLAGVRSAAGAVLEPDSPQQESTPTLTPLKLTENTVAVSATRSDHPAAPVEEPASTPTDLSEEWYFAPSGDGYYLAGFGEFGHLSGRYKGLSDIARLIQTPGQLVPMLDLDGASEAAKADRHSRQPVAEKEDLAKARRDLRELKEDLAKAVRENNTVDADVTRREIEEQESLLKSATGRGGKLRDLNNLFGRLRPKIHGRLQTAYEKLRGATPPMTRLANHFEASIESQGSGFIYQPPGDPPPWTFERRANTSQM